MRKLYTILFIVTAFLTSSFIPGPETPAIGNMESQSKVIRFYPNPATTVISFEFDKSVDKSYFLQIYNFIGKKMTEVRITESKVTVSLDDNYFRGLYIYQLRDAGNKLIESGKFQVSR